MLSLLSRFPDNGLSKTINDRLQALKKIILFDLKFLATTVNLK
jgi:hypothetical protein